jgi:hypothetical protein
MYSRYRKKIDNIRNYTILPTHPRLRLIIRIVFCIVLGIVGEVEYLFTSNRPVAPVFPLYTFFPLLLAVSILAPFVRYARRIRDKKDSVENYFRKTNEKNDIKYFHYNRIIFYIVVPLLVILILISYTKIGSEVEENLDVVGGGEFIRTLQFILVLVINANLITIVPSFMTREFWFYFSKAYIKLTKTEEYEVVRTRYLISSLALYDKYLRKALNLRIKDPEKIYDKIICLSMEEKSGLIISIANALGGEKLDLVRILSKKYLVELNSDQFMVEEKLSERIKDVSGLAIPIVTITVTIIGLFFK